MANLFYIAAHFRGYIFPMEGCLCYRSKLNSGQNFLLILYFLSLLALIIQELGLETKETENQGRLKNFNLNLILTYNIYMWKLYNYHNYSFIIFLS